MFAKRKLYQEYSVKATVSILEEVPWKRFGGRGGGRTWRGWGEEVGGGRVMVVVVVGVVVRFLAAAEACKAKFLPLIELLSPEETLINFCVRGTLPRKHN